MDIIFLTGFSAVGKTTIAKKLGERLNCSVISLHGIFHSLAKENGFGRVRYWLGEVGIDRMLEEQRVKLAQLVEGSTGSLIIDDLIDPQTPVFIRDRYPENKVVVILVEGGRSLQEQRIQQRMGVDSKEALSELNFLDRVKKDAGIEKVIKDADFEISNTGTVDEAVSKLAKFLIER